MAGQSYWLLDKGTSIEAGDEFYDADFHVWEAVNLQLLGRPVRDSDIVRRSAYDLSGLLQQLVKHMSVGDEWRDGRWQSGFDALLNEARRRLGIKTMDDYLKSEVRK